MTLQGALLKRFGVLLACSAVSLTGCKTFQSQVSKQADADPNLRPKIVASARSSCLSSAQKDFPQIPNREAYVTEYCDCFATKGLQSFSNSEIAMIGFTGLDKMSPEQKTKLDNAATMCVSETQQKVNGTK